MGTNPHMSLTEILAVTQTTRGGLIGSPWALLDPLTGLRSPRNVFGGDDLWKDT